MTHVISCCHFSVKEVGAVNMEGSTAEEDAHISEGVKKKRKESPQVINQGNRDPTPTKCAEQLQLIVQDTEEEQGKEQGKEEQHKEQGKEQSKEDKQIEKKEEAVSEKVRREAEEEVIVIEEDDSGEHDDTGKWTCAKCQLLNPDQVKQCLSCQTTKPKDEEKTGGLKVPQRQNAVKIRKQHPVDDGKEKGDQEKGDTEKGDSVEKEKSKMDDVDSGMDVDTWNCRRCTLENKMISQRCIMCGAPREDNAVKGINASLLDKYPAISPRKVKPVTSPKLNGDSSARGKSSSKVDSEWTCQKCTFLCNPAWKFTCDMCDKPRNVYGAHMKGVPKNSKINPEVFEFPSNNVNRTALPVMNVIDGTPVKTIGKHKTKDDEWSCPRCTLLNKKTASVCAACTCPRPSRDIDTPSTPNIPNTWVCGQCTLRNENTLMICNVCQASRMGSARQPSDSSSPSTSQAANALSNDKVKLAGWICECSFKNDAVNLECMICDAPNSRGTIVGKTPAVSAASATASSSSASSSSGVQATASCSTATAESTIVSRPAIARQKTICMMDVRRKEEKEAMEQWEQIVDFCKVVSEINLLL